MAPIGDGKVGLGMTGGRKVATIGTRLLTALMRSVGGKTAVKELLPEYQI